MAIFNFIGQPHSGKTTLANHLKKVLELSRQDRKVFVIDGDILRQIITNKDYSEAGRRYNITTAYNIAKYLDSTEEFDVIIAVVSPFLDIREKFKLESDVTEIFVHTTNIRGRENFHVKNYEYPESNFIDIDTTDVDELTSINEILEKINLKNNNNGN
jgi:adenylylsulfate kinase-like enzyme